MSIIGAAIGAAIQGHENKELAREQMAFQERMSNTAYQRAVVDMRSAGINPLMAYKQGGASTPQGSSRSAPSAWANLGSPVTAYQEWKRRTNEIKQQDATRKETKYRTWREESQGHLNDALISEAEAREAMHKARTRSEELRHPGLELDAEIDSSAYGRFTRQAGRALPLAAGVGGLLTGMSFGAGRGVLRRNKPKTRRGTSRQRTYQDDGRSYFEKERYDY